MSIAVQPSTPPSTPVARRNFSFLFALTLLGLLLLMCVVLAIATAG